MKRILMLSLLVLGMGFTAMAQPKLEDYFVPSTATPASPDAQGFVTRWTLLDPIAKPELRSNDMFTDSWLRNEFSKEYFKDQFTMVPKDGQKVKLDKTTSLTWHSLDATRYNVKLYRFAKCRGLNPTEGLYLAVTVINVPQDVTVRFAIGSNSGSQWWLNGEELLLLSNDRRMVVDDVVSKKVTLKAGKNVIRGAVINGPGMSDFCMRLYDENGNIYKNFTVTNQ